MKLFKNTLVSLIVFSPYFTLAQTLDTTLTPGDRHPQVSTLQKILNSIGQKVTEIGKETTYYGSLTSSAIKAIQCKYGIVCSGTPETTGFGRVGPRTLALLNSLKNTFGNVGRFNQLGAGIASTEGLLYSYSFDGNTTDSKGGNTGTANGSPTYSTGKVGQAIVLDGTDDYVSTDPTKSASLNGLGAVTISYWIKPSTLDGYPIARWGTNRQFSQTFIGSKLRFYWRVGGTGSAGTTLDHVSSANISANSWNHITVVYNNPTSKIYINGVLDSSKDGVGGALNSSVADALVFGKGTGGYFNGSVDDVNIYSRALSDSEILDIYSASGGTPSPALTPTPDPTPTPTPAPAGSYTLTVNKSGSGTVTGTGISCGSDCTENVTSGTSVALTATPASGAAFTGWSGACTGDSTCNVSLTSNKSVTATFTSSSVTPASVAPVGASSYYVSPSGSDTNAGIESSPLKTIQKAAELARAGTTVYVLAGTYPEHVTTKAGGTSDSSRVTFKAVGLASMQGFEIVHPYVTVEGFDIAGYTSGYQPHIRVGVNVAKGSTTVLSKGDNCKIINNTIRGSAPLVGGVFFVEKEGQAPNNCQMTGNRLSGLNYSFLITAGLNHRFENNVFEWLNSRDYLILFGGNHVFKRNVFWKGNKISGTANHPDWMQLFNNNGDESYGHLFEENYIEGLEEGVQLGQINSGGTLDNPFMNPNTRDITFRRNVFANIGNNFNISVPGVTFDHNTFYRLAFSQSGIGFGGNLTRGESDRALITNNAFVAGAETRTDSGFYFLSDAAYMPEAIIAHVTKDGSDSGRLFANAFHADMVSRGYMDSNGKLTSAGKAITDISQFILSEPYMPYRTLAYENLRKVQALSIKMLTTSKADYNFVSNTPATGYSAKPSTPTKCANGIFSSFAFCEVHGVNGGDPKFRSITNLLGPDGKIFTLDDGLKPQSGSPLCGNGVEGSDIGAYSCDPNRVFSTGDSGNVGTDPGTPITPTVDDVFPTVAVTSPVNGQTLSGNVTLTANASDNIGISSVRFMIDGIKIGNEDRSAPYASPWNSAMIANGPHVITAVAKDPSSNLTTSASVNVTTSNVTTYAITINRLGLGSGEVKGTGLLCGGDCSEIFSSATTVTLTAVPLSGSSFGGWGGDCSGTSTICIVSVDSAKNVSATFNEGTVVTPPPASTKFVLNDKVKVNNNSVNIRPSPTTANTPLGQHNTGDLGNIIGGPVAAEGYVWWNVNFDGGADGWVVETYLDKQTIVVVPPPTTGSVIAHWKFDEGAGSTVTDLSGNGNNVTLENGLGWAPGKSGSSLLFTEPTHLGRVKDTTQKTSGMFDLIGKNPTTITAWIYPTDWSSYGNGRGDIIYSGASAFRVRSGTNNLEFTNNFFATPIVGSAQDSIKLNKWNFVSVTRNTAGEVTFYVNGVQSGPANQFASPFLDVIDGNRGTCIGIKCLNVVDTFAGKIDELQVYNKPLSASEIKAIYDATVGELPPTSVSCTPTNIKCVDDTPGSTQEYSTIQACANVAVAGDTCLVHPGNYPEFIQTVNSGTATNKITFKANGLAIIEGIRIKNQHITVEGFDMTKYGAGVSPAHVTVEPSGSFCTVKNNKIRDGIYLSSTNYSFNSSAKTITNPAGGFLAAGFEAGAKIYIASDINNWIKNHDTVKTIKSVTDTVITVEDADTLITEGPVFSLIYVTRIDKSGVKGIDFNLTSSAGSANNCVISGNLLSNIVGAAVNISGSNHIFERNIIEKMSGWWIFTFGGDNNVFRYNHIRNSPRYAGFGAPGDGAVHSDSTGSWDFYSSIFRSFGSPSISAINNVFEYNIVENVDNQFMTIGAYAPGLSTAPLPSSKTIFRNNVFSGIEGIGAIHRPESIFQNNTFYNAGFDSTGGPVIIVSGTREGSADGSIIKNNAFVGNSTGDPTRTTGGFYSVQDAVMAEAPNYNFVSGPASTGYPSKSDFVGKEETSSRLNGGNPMFRNVNNPAGPDGILFTADDGFRPAVGSPLCTGGSNGGPIGAYACDGSLPPTTTDTTNPSISITSPANSSTISGSTNLTVSASDNVGVVGVRYLVDGVQAGLEVTSSPFSATWSGMSDGTYTLTAEARDAAGNKKLSQPVSVTVKTPTVNVAPVLSLIGSKTIAENSTLTFSLSGTDGNADALTYSATNLPAGSTFTGTTFSWRPSFTQSGSYTVTFEVSDGKGLTDTETVTITVSNLNQTPTANAGIDQSITLPSSSILSATGSTDPDGQSLTYSWSKVSGPGNVNFSSNTNIAPTATFSLAGTYTLRVAVSDGTLSSNDTVTITVLSNPSADDDLDGVLDGVDLCPNSRVGATVNTRGCPLPKISKFTTKPILTNEDLRSIETLELGNTHGKVSWKKTGTPYSLVKITDTAYDSLDLDTHLNIKAGEISLDSASVPELNRPATLTFFNVTIKNPEILKNGVICSECDLSYSGTTLTFTVEGFSTYTIVSNDDPTVSITQPTSGIITGGTTIKASATDDLGIESVSFYANNSLIGTDTSAPYEISFEPSSGSYTLTAKARDVGGLEKTSSSVSVTVNKKTSSGGSRSKGVVVASATNSQTPVGVTLPANATREQTIQYLVAKIQELLTLYNQMKALEGGSATNTTDTVLKGFQFTKTFGIGANSSEVRYLQRFLNTHGFPVGTGLGSYGKEVDTFGPVTQTTLKKYQTAQGIEATGYFGQLTKSKVNQTLLAE